MLVELAEAMERDRNRIRELESQLAEAREDYECRTLEAKALKKELAEANAKIARLSAFVGSQPCKCAGDSECVFECERCRVLDSARASQQAPGAQGGERDV